MRLVLLATVWLATAPLAACAPDKASAGAGALPCRQAAQLLQERRLASAEGAYTQALHRGAGSCAEVGLVDVQQARAVARAEVADARTAERSGNGTAARTHFATAARLDRENVAARDGLARLGGQARPGDVTTVPRGTDPPRTAFAGPVLPVITPLGETPWVGAPSTTDRPLRASAKGGGRSMSWWTSVVVLAVLLLLSGTVLTRLDRRVRWRLFGPVARASALGRTLVGPLLTRVRLVPADASALTHSLGGSFTQLTAEWLQGVPGDSADLLLQVDAPVGAGQRLPELTVLPDGPGRLPAPVRWLWRSDLLRVRTVLHPVTVHGGGVRIELVDPAGRCLRAETLWNVPAAPDDVASCLRLAPRAAAWIVYALHEVAPEAIRPPVTGPGASDRYASFLTALEEISRGLHAEAAEHFRRARRVPGGHEERSAPLADAVTVAAWCDEACALAGTGSDRDRDRAVAVLGDMVGDDDGGEITASVLRVHLQLVGALVDRAVAARTSRPVDGATKEVDAVLSHARRLARLVSCPLPEPSAEKFRDRARAGALLLLARSLALADPPARRLAPAQCHLPGTAAQDLVRETAPGADAALRGLVDQEERPAEGSGAQGAEGAAAAEDLPRPDPDQLVREVTARLPLGPAARYQLAAYLVQTGAEASVHSHIQEITRHRLLRARAAHDPVLGAWVRAVAAQVATPPTVVTAPDAPASTGTGDVRGRVGTIGTTEPSGGTAAPGITPDDRANWSDGAALVRELAELLGRLRQREQEVRTVTLERDRLRPTLDALHQDVRSLRAAVSDLAAAHRSDAARGEVDPDPADEANLTPAEDRSPSSVDVRGDGSRIEGGPS